MTRPLKRYQLVLDIVGAAIGALITVFLDLSAIVVSDVTGWITDPSLAITHHIVVALILWTAAALGRLSPPVALAVAWGGAVVQMAGGMMPSIINVALFGVVYSTAARGSRRVMWLGGASVVAGGAVAGPFMLLALGEANSPDDASISAFAFGLVISLLVFLSLLIAWGAGLLRRAVLRREASEVAQLRAEAIAVEEQERVRIARDMHDIVAHSLAVVIAQSDGARYAAASNPELTQEALSTIGTTARDALSDVRLLLTQLRHRQGDGPQPTLADLDDLLAQVRQAGGDLRVTIDPEPEGEPPAATQIAVYRILQEATTNALRHGAGDIEVRLAWQTDAVEVEVVNAVAGTPSRGGGHGLIGMRERALLVGGTLLAEGDARQFVVRAVLPIGGDE